MITYCLALSEMRIYSSLLFFLFLALSFLSTAQGQTWTLKACIDTALKANLKTGAEFFNEEGQAIDLFKNNTLPSFEYYHLGKQENLDYFGQQESKKYIKENLTFALQTESNDIRLDEKGMTLKVLDAYLKVLYDLEQIEIANQNIQLFQELQDHAIALKNEGKTQEAESLVALIKSDADQFSAFHKICELSFDQIALMELMKIPLDLDFDIEKVNWHSVENRAGREKEIAFAQLADSPSLRQALNNHQVTQRNLSNLETQYELVDKSFQKVQKRFKYGTISAGELDLIKKNYFQVQSELLQAKYQFLFAKEMLDFYKKGMISI